MMRVGLPSLPLSMRRAGFDEVELSCDEQQISAEVNRCLQCDLEICLALEKRTSEAGG